MTAHTCLLGPCVFGHKENQGWKGTQGLSSALGILVAKPPEYMVPTGRKLLLGSLVTGTAVGAGSEPAAPPAVGSGSHSHHPGALLACSPRRPSCWVAAVTQPFDWDLLLRTPVGVLPRSSHSPQPHVSRFCSHLQPIVPVNYFHNNPEM